MLNTGLGFSDEFELETLRYAEKSGKRVKYKDFLKNVKDKVILYSQFQFVINQSKFRLEEKM